MKHSSDSRSKIRALHRADAQVVLSGLVKQFGPDTATRKRVQQRAIRLVQNIRSHGRPGLMEKVLSEYGLSTDEGVALMCLAEALLRVPDAETVDALISDKIAGSAWKDHLGKSESTFVNAASLALAMTGDVLQQSSKAGVLQQLHGAVRRLGTPVIRMAVRRAMKDMGNQFVLGETIEAAIARGVGAQNKGYTYSYDMLGEAAITAKDADRYYRAYQHALQELAKHSHSHDIRDNPGISVKLSALHPRYEMAQKERVMAELVPRLSHLAIMAKNAGAGLNVDAEEADRLDLSLDVIEAVLRMPELAGWGGFGVVIQAYGKRAGGVIDWLDALSAELDRRVMVRLVKGAYWDTEIKQAQVDGVPDFPVFTRKAETDISYICCAQKLLNCGGRIYPQFATHNAHTVAAIQELAAPDALYEFQRLHGMGESLYDAIMEGEEIRCRIYAPVGAHRELLAYLVRRLLENGANSSFVNQITDPEIPVETVAGDPFAQFDTGFAQNPSAVLQPPALFGAGRKNSAGWDLSNPSDIRAFHLARDPFRTAQWSSCPIIANNAPQGAFNAVFSPQNPQDCVGKVATATPAEVELALSRATSWAGTAAETRQAILERAADLYEENTGELLAALCREAGKTALDAVSEIREAVDFLRYYGAQADDTVGTGPQGVVTCISPWNFPLAIFTGQISAALAAGNGVLAKPADPTPIIASIAVALLHKAGVPANCLQLVPGAGADVGARLTSDPRVSGVCFTGSTGVAQTIYRAASKTLAPDSVFVAETGGLNAMIVDSTALPEQAIRDIVEAAFRSGGQRCSALRILYLQEDIAENFLEMLFGMMDELEIGDPWQLSSDIGPIITDNARKEIAAYVENAARHGRVLKRRTAPKTGTFLGPAVIECEGIKSLGREVFGPVLHVATYRASDLGKVVRDVNSSGYGLTFGIHSRLNDRIAQLCRDLHVGNIYVNRNQIGAVVESQPFGGHGLSGTGPKAGGPYYVGRFRKRALPLRASSRGPVADKEAVQAALLAAQTDTRVVLKEQAKPGPTGEANTWSAHPRGTILCLGPTAADARKQAEIAHAAGCAAVCVAPGASGHTAINGYLVREDLSNLDGFSAVALWSECDDLAAARAALAHRAGPLIPLIATSEMAEFCVLEKHVCTDTTAAGGNASLLAMI